MLRPEILRPDTSNGQLDAADSVAGGTRDRLGTLFRVVGSSSGAETTTATGDPLLATSSSVKELAWLVPAVIVGIFVMIGLAFACYLGVRRLELRMLHWCRVHCACCHCWEDEERGRLLNGDVYNGLSQTSRKESVRMKDFRDRGPSNGLTRDTRKEYVPRNNPFDYD
ncbi:hypothetical protein ACOMHN_026100 [Nucella lapillus]